MAEVIKMPLLSDTMKEGKIVKWHKKVGDEVKSDDVLAEVQTDKAIMEIEPYVDGFLLYVGVPEGEAAAVNQIIAIIGEEGEDYKSLLDGESGNEKSANADKQDAEKTEEKQDDTKDKEDDKEADETADDEKKSEDVEAEDAPKADDSKEKKPEKKELPTDLEVVRMPLLSDTMKKGKIVAWLKEVGDEVTSDDVLAEVETDKATMEVIGYADGTLLYQGVPAGEAVEVNGVLAVVGNADINIDEYLPTILNEGKEESTEEKPTASKEEDSSSKKDSTQKASADTTKDKEPTDVGGEIEKARQDIKVVKDSDDSRVKASPLARNMAKDKGISLSGIDGTGDGGRIVKRDIDNYSPQQAMSGGASGAGVPAFDASTAKESHTDTPLSQMREIIAQRLGESKFSAPHFYLKISVEMDDFLKVRKQINAVSDVKISVNDMIIKACALSLVKHPEVNSSWLGDKIRTNHHVHIGSAVAIPDGLIVPVIKFAHQKTLGQIATDANALYGKAKSGKLQPAEFTGNTFTISNLGMMGIDEFTAIINPPDACILAVGKTTPTPVVNEAGELAVKQIMKLTLSCDHRVVDGAVGATFLQTLKNFIEQPVLMLF